MSGKELVYIVPLYEAFFMKLVVKDASEITCMKFV